MNTRVEPAVIEMGHPSMREVDTRGEHRAQQITRALRIAVPCTLAFAVLAFGAVQEWANLVLRISCAAMFVGWALAKWLRKEKMFPGPFTLPTLMLLVLVCVQLWTGRSAYAHATHSGLLQLAAYAFLVLACRDAFLGERSYRRVAFLLASGGFVYALFAIVQRFTSNNELYWSRTPSGGAAVFGSYVNHNHYAGLMEMLAPMPLLLAMSRRIQWEYRVLLVFASGVMAGSVFLSRSRGGMLALMAGLALVAGVLATIRRLRRWSLSMAAVGVVLATIIVFTAGAESLHRLGDLTDDLRAAINRDGIAMIQQKPWLGYGLETFEYVYPQHRSFISEYYVSHAHNDVLQFGIEMGVLGLFAALWFVTAVYWTALRRISREYFDSVSRIRLAALAGVTAMLVHSFVDFNLHIPANAAMFTVLCALATMKIEYADV